MRKILKKLVSLAIVFALMIQNGVFALEKSTSSDSIYLIINSKTNYMGYYKNGELIEEFRVATGKSSTPTPKGKYKIVNKIVNRPYYSGGIAGGSPNNPLGNRWMGLQVGATYGTTYGIHGNNNESSIGKNISGGCIRMHNSDIKRLYEEIPIGAYAIIDSSDLSYTEIAAKYGVKLNESDVKNLEEAFNNFSANLKNTNTIISKSSDATQILSSNTNYTTIYNKLTSSEKSSEKVVNIQNEYNNLIKVFEGIEAVLKFYENVVNNANNAIKDVDLANKLNDLDNQDEAMRGRARRLLNAAISVEELENSARLSYVSDLYYDAVNFLLVCDEVAKENTTNAQNLLKKIKDSTLKNIAQEYVSDVENHWAQSNIEQAIEDNWINDKIYVRANDSITRAEFVKIVNKAFGFSETTKLRLSDVDSNDWYYDDISIAINQGYVVGYDNDTFRPNQNITREEVAKIITEISGKLDEEENIDLSQYKDFEEISLWALPYVNFSVNAGYIGNSGEYFRPKDNITRAEAIVTLQRIVN